MSRHGLIWNERVGSRPATSGRVRASKKGFNGGGAPAQKNGATKHRAGASGELAAEPAVKLVGGSEAVGQRAVLQGGYFSVAPGEAVEGTRASGSGQETVPRLP